MKLSPLVLALGLLWLNPVSAAVEQNPDDPREVLYWYDPMYPQQHFEQPGPSPFMEMDLVPRYAEPDSDGATLSIAPRVTQNLGMRVATVRRQDIGSALTAQGTLTFDERAVVRLQSRAEGFVEKVYARAPEDLIAQGDPLVDVLVPAWTAAQEEFLALRGLGLPALVSAARQRMRLVGMPSELIQQVAQHGTVQPVWTLRSPMAGMIRQLEVREGMTLRSGQLLAQINGLQQVWLEVAVPEAQSLGLHPGQPVTAQLPALPGATLEARIAALLPEASVSSRTVRVRVALPNNKGLLRPGMSAQVQLQPNVAKQVLTMPSEAVMHTGQRTLVMVFEGEGRFRLQEIRTGREAAGHTEVLAGLTEGQQVVASGQFLLDSEASLQGLEARLLETLPSGPTLHEAEGDILDISSEEVLLSHGPFKTLNMPSMTMSFPLADPVLAKPFKAGDRVRVWVEQTDAGLPIRRMEKQGDEQ